MILLQQQNRGRRELLGQRPNSILCFRAVRDAPINVSEAITLVEEQRATLCDQHRSHEDIARQISFSRRIQVCGDWCLGARVEAAFLSGGWREALEGALSARPDPSAFQTNGAAVIAGKIKELCA